jgi:hypothetical protein
MRRDVFQAIAEPTRRAIIALENYLNRSEPENKKKGKLK